MQVSVCIDRHNLGTSEVVIHLFPGDGEGWQEDSIEMSQLVYRPFSLRLSSVVQVAGDIIKPQSAKPLLHRCSLLRDQSREIPTWLGRQEDTAPHGKDSSSTAICFP